MTTGSLAPSPADIGIGGIGAPIAPKAGSFQQRVIVIRLTRGTQTTEFGKPAPVTPGKPSHAIARISCGISQSLGGSFGTASLRIYGLTGAEMNQFSRVANLINLDKAERTFIAILAGTLESQSVCYEGVIIEAAPDFNDAPNVPFLVTCMTGFDLSLIPSPPKSFKGSVDAADIMKVLADEAGFTFENNGVSAMLSNPYLWGNWRQQFDEVVASVRMQAVVDYGTLAIWPVGAARNLPSVAISPTTGLVGYPSRLSSGVAFRCLFNPSLRPGVIVDLNPGLELGEGMVLNCKGSWPILSVNHTLESNIVGGAWFSDVTTTLPSAGVTNPNTTTKAVS